VTEESGFPPVSQPAEPKLDPEPAVEPEAEPAAGFEVTDHVPDSDLTEVELAPEPELEPAPEAVGSTAEPPLPEWLIEVQNNAPGVVATAIEQLYRIVTGR